MTMTAGVAGRVALEALTAMVGAEVVGAPLVDRPRGGVVLLHLHTADGVEGKAGASSQAGPVAMEPVEDGEDTEEPDVEECGVVPPEGGLDDVLAPRLGDEPQRGE